MSIKGFFKEYRFLSNFHECDIFYEGLLYKSTEAAYQAAKCKNQADKIKFTTCAPALAKKMGMGIDLRPDWDLVKYDVMLSVTIEKYKDPSLRNRLLATADSYLEETNYWGDQYWGVCRGVGKNNLGKILMAVRDMYRTVG